MTAPLAASIVDVLSANAAIANRISRSMQGGSAAPIAIIRRDITRELERQVQRAIWRAERRGRGMPLEARQSAPWVNAQRRKIAWELFRALRSLDASTELARAIAAQACERFPRDGVVIAESDPRKPRSRGENLRARGKSPRQLGTSPRARRRAAASLSQENVSQALAPDPSCMHNLLQDEKHATPPASPAATIDELAPGWTDLKAQLLDGLSPAERLRARTAARDDLERLERQQRRPNHPPPTTDTRS